MASNKNIDRICVIITLLALLLTLLFMNGEALGLEMVVDADAEKSAGTDHFTANDLNADWDTSNATVITMNGSGGKILGSGAYFYEGNLVISNGGWYVLSGVLEDGSISVDAYSSAKVWILLNGVEVSCSDDACLRVEQADKVFLTLAEGSENHFSSGAEYSESALDDGTGGAIYAHDDLTINGSGSLTVNAGYHHGIEANDALVITGGAISITCPADGLHVNDSCSLTGAALTISAGDDGIHSDTAVYIAGGTVQITECYEGIEAPVIEIDGGDITLYPSDDGLNANGGSGDMFGFGGFGGGPNPGSFAFGGSGDTFSEDGAAPQAPEAAAVSESEEESAAETEETYIRITGGTLTIVNENARDADGIDSNGSIYIEGGSIRVSMANNGGYALDVGSESGGVMEISGGDIVGCGSYSMAESFDSSSAQPSVLYIYSTGAEAGTTVALEDAAGNVLLQYTAPCAFSCVNLSCPELTVGETYRMIIGDNMEEITLTEVSASYGDAQSGGFFGSMNFGGMRPGGFGGRGRRGTADSDSSGEDSEQNWPVPAGEFPDFDGEFPDFDGEFPGFDGEFPDSGNGMQGPPAFGGERPGMPGGFSASTEAAEADTSTVSPVAWGWVAASAAVLLAGLAFAGFYKRRRGLPIR